MTCLQRMSSRSLMMVSWSPWRSSSLETASRHPQSPCPLHNYPRPERHQEAGEDQSEVSICVSRDQSQPIRGQCSVGLLGGVLSFFWTWLQSFAALNWMSYSRVSNAIMLTRTDQTDCRLCSLNCKRKRGEM